MDDILSAVNGMFACLRPGGGWLITVRDYNREQRGRNLVKPYGVREDGGRRCFVFQAWDFEGEHYDLTMCFVEEDREAARPDAIGWFSECRKARRGLLSARYWRVPLRRARLQQLLLQLG